MKTLEEKQLEVEYVVEKVRNYFNISYIGSYMLFKNNLIKFESINDLDLLVPDNKWENVKAFLKDYGYDFEKDNVKDEYGNVFKFHSVLTCSKDGCLNIDLCRINEHKKILSINELIYEKIKRGTLNDYKQVIEALTTLQLNKDYIYIN